MSLKFNVCPSLRSILNPHLLDGQVVYEQESQKMYLFNDNAWIELGKPATDSSQVYKKYPTVCPNCGAPHNPSMVCCEYCGTFFE